MSLGSILGSCMNASIEPRYNKHAEKVWWIQSFCVLDFGPLGPLTGHSSLVAGHLLELGIDQLFRKINFKNAPFTGNITRGKLALI